MESTKFSLTWRCDIGPILAEQEGRGFYRRVQRSPRAVGSPIFFQFSAATSVVDATDGIGLQDQFDVAVFTGSNGSGVGVIIRNNMGEVMAALLARGPSVRDSKEAEALACKRALEFAGEARF